MTRLSRLVVLSVLPLVAVVAALFLMVIAPGSPAAATGAQPGHSAAGVSRPVPMASSPCVVCVTAHDAICWESVGPCGMPVVVTPLQNHPITMHYRTVAMTATPNVDYVPVQDAIATIPAGHTTVYVYIQLLPAPPTTPNKQFAVAFFNIVGGQLTRPQAIITLTPPSN